MRKPLETQVIISFSATAPQLDSFTQRVNESARRKSNVTDDFIADLPLGSAFNGGI
jgi:hypothetical protein